MSKYFILKNPFLFSLVPISTRNTAHVTPFVNFIFIGHLTRHSFRSFNLSFQTNISEIHSIIHFHTEGGIECTQLTQWLFIFRGNAVIFFQQCNNVNSTRLHYFISAQSGSWNFHLWRFFTALGLWLLHFLLLLHHLLFSHNICAYFIHHLVSIYIFHGYHITASRSPSSSGSRYDHWDLMEQVAIN